MCCKFKLRFFTFISIIMLCIGVTYKGLQNDTFYVIKLGGDILKNGVDLIDHYCWIADLSYTYPHWLYDLFIYIIYYNFDFLGIYISNIILFIILILSVYIINLRINKNEFLASIMSIITIPCLLGFVTARAQLVTIILFLWQVYFIERLISSGKKKYIIYLTFISWLIANIHATIWPFYFILYLPFIAEYFIYKILCWKQFNININKKLVISKIDNFKLLIISFLSGFVMGFLSPSKICFTYIFKVMQGNSQNFIMEHAPMLLINNISFLLFILAILFLLIFSDVKIKLKELFMIGGLIFMSLSSIRHSVFFYVIGLLYFTILFNRYLENKNDKTFEILGIFFVKNKIIYLLSFILIIIISGIYFKKNYSFDYVSLDDYPVEAVNFIKGNLDVDKIRLYNDYNFGAYLLFHDIPVFIDSRCDLYLKEFNGLNYSIFDDAMEIEKDYEEKFDFYNVSHALLDNDSMLYIILSKDVNYTILYEDENFTLFEKNNYNNI